MSTLLSNGVGGMTPSSARQQGPTAAAAGATGGAAAAAAGATGSKSLLTQGGEFDPQKYERPSMKQDEIVALKKLFDACDVENSGVIFLKDLKSRMQNAGYESRSDVIGDMVNYFDRDGRTSLNFGQFLDLLTTDATPFKTPQDIARTFQQFDVEGSGALTQKMLARAAKEFNMVPHVDIPELIKRADTDGDGKISGNEFFYIMEKQTFP